MDDVAGDFVPDCSVAMAWCLDDEATPDTTGVLDRLADLGAVVPSLWRLEVANVALVGERRNRLDEARTRRSSSLLDGLPIRVEGLPGEKAFAETALLARDHHPSAYDAASPELAIRRGLPPASLDGRLVAAAKAAGVTIFEL